MAHAEGWQASAVVTIGKIVEPLNVTPASAVRSTGIFILDRNLGGELPSGSVVYLSGDPGSMPEIFIHQFTQTRKTYYVVTGRRPMYVAQNIRSRGYYITEITFIDTYIVNIILLLRVNWLITWATSTWTTRS